MLKKSYEHLILRPRGLTRAFARHSIIDTTTYLEGKIERLEVQLQCGKNTTGMRVGRLAGTETSPSSLTFSHRAPILTKLVLSASAGSTSNFPSKDADS